MPGMKGDQLAAVIKKQRPEQRIIMVSAFADEFTTYGKSSGGVDLVINKPFSLAELRGAIVKVLS
jgi:DNA-binding response OmpR family regulator